MAKPLTRLLRKLCNKMGYDLLRLQKTDIHPEAVSGLGRGGGFDAFEAGAMREVKQLDIYLKTCARIDVFAQTRGRFIGVPKCELILRCLKSLIRSIAFAKAEKLEIPIRLNIIDDHSSDDCVTRIQAMLATSPCSARLLPLAGTGIGAALTESYRLAREEAKDLIYVTNDDYLYDEQAILEMVRSYKRLAGVLKQDPVLFVSDYPDRYKHVYPTHILLGSDRHWRGVHSTTGVDLLSRDILVKYWEIYMAFGRYGVDPSVTEANTIDRIYKEVPCYSPMPSLAVHLQHFDTLSPYFDWEKWWKASAV